MIARFGGEQKPDQIFFLQSFTFGCICNICYVCAHIETGFIYILLYTSFACVRNLKIRRETKKQRDANKLSQCFDKVNLRRRRVVAPVFRAQLRHVG